MITENLISVVVCSINEELFAQFEKNVAETIGCDYQMIQIKNILHPRGICEVYNEGLDNAKGDIICYCHEDILFKTIGWGHELTTLLEDKNIGLVGVAGATYKSKYPASWVAVPESYYRLNMIQKLKDGTQVTHCRLDEGIYSEVAVLDGCFMAGRKQVFNQYRWNITLTGFHMYDMDISLRLKTHYLNVVSNNIKILHLSEGSFDEKWFLVSEKFHLSMKKTLPTYTIKLNATEIKNLDYYALSSIITLLEQTGRRIKTLKYFILALILKPFKKKNIKFFNSIIKIN